MKNKITIRLIVTNLSILIFSLLCFFIISSYNLNSQAREQAELQIAAESSAVIERTINMEYVYFNMADEDDSLHPPVVFFEEEVVFQTENEQASIHIYGKYENGELMLPTSDILSEYIDIDEDLEQFIVGLEANTADIIVVNGEKILVLVTPYLLLGEENAIISILAMETVNALTTSSIMLSCLVFIILVILSFFLICWQSMKITSPLKTLTVRTKRYANNDFTEPFIVNTGDEIESLSSSIQTMVENILQHEQTQISLYRNLSHELKTPLTAISGYAENISNGYYEDTKVPLKIIQDECTRIRNILDNLIFLSNIDSNMEVFSFKRCDLVSLVTTSIEKVESIAILSDIDIYYDPPEEILVSCDKDKLMRAFINILSNALKYTKDCIEIEIKKTEDSVCVIISDNGDGFEQSKLDKLFVSTTGASASGNGIGLLIVYEIVTRHKGSISAKNRDNSGAEICITLKLDE